MCESVVNRIMFVVMGYCICLLNTRIGTSSTVDQNM